MKKRRTQNKNNNSIVLGVVALVAVVIISAILLNIGMISPQLSRMGDGGDNPVKPKPEKSCRGAFIVNAQISGTGTGNTEAKARSAAATQCVESWMGMDAGYSATKDKCLEDSKCKWYNPGITLNGCNSAVATCIQPIPPATMWSCTATGTVTSNANCGIGSKTPEQGNI